MLRVVTRISCFFALLLAASFALAQVDFSAEVVDLQKPASPVTAKMYFAKDKIRIESQGGPHGGGAIIVNFGAQTTIVLMAQQHMYMEMPAQTQGQRMGYVNAFFRAGDVENACGDWQKMTTNKGASCHKVGGETVSGRDTVKYETTSASGEVSYFWLDPKLRFPVKWQGKSSDGELRHIQEGPLAASLFEVPAGFTKMDMGGMMMQQPH
ncbi:MAG: hypothetical protein WAL56_02715 [Candidatus Sulfotelmatobacter sp.]